MSKRKLAAIMFTDIVGYTSLMGSNEKRAFEVLKKNRLIHRSLIRKHHGRWLKEMGDGILASFSSNIDAVMCALSIQKAAVELDIPLRIAIHQGDVIFEKNDVLGDGVNIASRMQGQAEKNGIVISETVNHDIRNKEGLIIDLIGDQSLKGVAKPVRIYRVTCKDNKYLDFTIDTGELVQPFGLKWAALLVGIVIIAVITYSVYTYNIDPADSTDKKRHSVLVLPFDNYTGSDTLEYFVAGMHNSLIGDIGKVSALRVISQTTANAYRDVEKPIPEIASELDVNTVIEAAVLCLGDSICLQVKVLSAYPEEKQLWVQDYYEEKSRILNLYNTVTREISEKINVILTPQEESLLGDSRIVDPEAYDAYLKGQYHWEQLSRESITEALQYFQAAIDIDPSWAAPYAGMAMAWGVLAGFEFIPPDSAAMNISLYLKKALELDPNAANSHYVKAITATWGQWNWEEGEKEFKKTLELNPNDALCRMYYSHLLMILHRFEESLYQADLALKLDPLRPLVLGLYGVVMYNVSGNFQSAIAHAQKAISIDPDNYFAYGVLQLAYYESGDYEKWFETWKKRAWWNDTQIDSVEKVFTSKGVIPAIRKIIEVNEEVYYNNGLISFQGQAENYLKVQEYDKAMDYLEKAYGARHGLLTYISLYPKYFPELKQNQRFISLLKKMDLPLD